MPLIKMIYCREVSLINNELGGRVEFRKCDDIKVLNNHIESQSSGLRILNAIGPHTMISNELKCISRGISLENSYSDPVTEEVIMKYNRIDAPTPVYNGGYSNVIIIPLETDEELSV